MKTDAGKGKQAGVKRAIHFGRKLLPLLIAAGFNYSALANPVGPQVINGQAGFNSQGNLLTITNTPGAIINWQSFSVNQGEITRFLQQNPGSSVLNRIVGQDPTQILGALQSNGRVFLINPNGILFGPGAQIDVNGLVASTLNIGNDDFLSGKLNFKAGDKAGQVINQGAITTPNGGQVYLIAPHVENSGVITSPNGEVMLAAGNSVQLVDSTNPDLRVVVSAPTDQAINLGQIVAQGGRIGIYGALINQRGRISADSAVVGENGKIIFKASKDTLLEAGSVTSATGAGKGGEIQVLGERVGLTGDARIDASGQQGGGKVLVGGDYQGKNPDIRNAGITYFDAKASIKADAIANGDGGKVIVWSDDTTRAYGNISARGGAEGGNGGFVEASGHNHLDFQGRVDTLAPQGEAGTLLLDPSNVTIDSAGENLNSGSFTGGIFSGAAGDSTLLWSTINGQAGNVEIRTSPAAGGGGDININASGTVTGPTTLTLLANNNINFAPSVSVGGSGNFNLVAGWNNTGMAVTPGTGNIAFGANSSLSTSGDVWFNAGNAVTQDPTAAVTANTLTIGNTSGVSLPGGISMSGSNMVNTLAANVSGGGALTFTNGKALTIGTGYTFNGIFATNNTNPINITTTAGDLTVALPVRSDGTGGSAITLAAANTLALNAAVESTSAAVAAGSVNLQAGNGVTSDANGVITANLLKIASGASVTLNAGNGINTLAGTSGGSFQFANANGFTVGTVLATSGLTASTGDITLKTGGLNSLLTVSQNVQATSGNVIYIADNLAHNAFTTTSGSGFVEVKPFTAATSVEFTPTVDAPGILRLSSSELNFSTSLLKVGNSAMTGNIAITEPVAPGAFSSLSLITNGAITQTAGSTITIAGLNADGFGGVALNEANAITNLGGHTNGGNFSFTDINAINVGLVDVNNGINVSTSGNIALTAGSNVTQSGSAVLATPGSLTVNAQTGIALANANVVPVVSLNNATGGNVTYGASATALSISAATAATGNINVTNTGGTLNVTNAGTGSGNITLTGSGNVTLSTATTGGAVNVTSTGGEILDGNSSTLNITGGVVNLTANTGIATDVTAATSVAAQTGAGNITLKSPGNLPIAAISTPGNVGLVSSGGTITDANAASTNISASSAGLASYAGIGTAADPIETQVSTLAANNSMAGGVYINNNGALFLGSISTVGGAVVIDNIGALTTGANPIQTAGGAVTLTAHSPLTIGAGGINTGSGAITLTAGASASPTATDVVTINGALTTTGAITLAGNSIAGSNVPNGTNVTTQIYTVLLPTLAQCEVDPTLAGCSTVLPSLTTCIANPATAGCSVVLPTLTTCLANPATAGCSVVLPTLDQCVATPTLAGCSIVLPTLGQCLFTPTLTGCSVVLPTLAQCTATPTLAGCSTALPTLSACLADPATAGCSVVLPTLSQCVATPSLAGCSIILPTLAQCIAAPTLSGCSAVLPTLSACITNPATAGCSVILPTLSQCLLAPALTGCSVVLPTLAQCVATPTLTGCSVVLPTLSQCTATPALAGCVAVVPSATENSEPVRQAINTTINIINTSTVIENDTSATDDDAGSGKVGQTSDSKKDKKKDTTGSDKTGAKNDANKKTYCN